MEDENIYMENSLFFKNESYYRSHNAESDNRREEDRELLVNCCGFSTYGFPIRVASTRRDYYLIYITEGSLKVRRPYNVTLNAGDIIIFSPDIEFEYASSKFVYYWVHFSGRAAGGMLSDSYLRTNIKLRAGKSAEGEKCLRKMFYEFGYRSPMWERSAAVELEKFLLLCGKANMEEEPKKNRENIAAAITYIRTHLEKELTIAELAERSYLSPSGFRRAFVAYTGKSPTEFIQNARMELAEQLLRDTDMRVSAVAACVGYNDALYFSRIFRGQFGQSPMQYRKSVQKN